MKYLTTKVFLTACLLAAIASLASAATPFYIQQVPPVASSGGPIKGKYPLRITVSSDENFADEDVKLGQIAVCSSSACYGSETPTSINIKNTKDGTSTLITEMLMPATELTSVHFEQPAGSKSISGELHFTKRLVIEPIYAGNELFIIVKKRR